jgi:malate dehydrogenase (quinone)
VRSLPSAVPDSANPDVVLVGGGIMSATLAALIGVVAPQWSITVFESAPDVAGESSQAWNNAGTGHAALCELNYTPADRTAGWTPRRPPRSTSSSRCPASSGRTWSAKA